MDTISTAKAHGGMQGIYSYSSLSLDGEMTFAVFMPPQAADELVPVLWYLSGLTCNHSNVMDKGEYRAAAAKHGVAIVCPDTSPRGDGVADDESWQLGKGAGFYIDATEEPWAANYQMNSAIHFELQEVVAENFDVDLNRQGIFGHSMGGHGALIAALREPERFKSCSAFAPIVNPSTAEWSRNAFTAYLGSDESKWAKWDAVRLIEGGARFSEFLVDQGTADSFLDDGLRPWLLEEACKAADIPLTLRMQDGYDHSYNFISTFMADHIAWHAKRLKA
ncbi:S-formylglutathione hydrolase [Ahrensia sp. R2A130]|uniref:S-formylglutathione hydrolase n=1 Tax=Ahrensia sp. R2A130 TaxID=744979 RepID=UPI0001E0A42A|nr:S-formylglutathione hydrolase [Ahrensia sp. R2A130]EFL90078.1 S-formylglutathione hydrolase [Ahrensia sp. R2A130]